MPSSQLSEFLWTPTKHTLEEAGSSLLLPWWAMFLWRLTCGSGLLVYARATGAFSVNRRRIATSYIASGITFVLLSAFSVWYGIRKNLALHDEAQCTFATDILSLHGVAILYSLFCTPLIMWWMFEDLAERPISRLPFWLLSLMPVSAHFFDFPFSAAAWCFHTVSSYLLM